MKKTILFVSVILLSASLFAGSNHRNDNDEINIVVGQPGPKGDKGDQGVVGNTGKDGSDLHGTDVVGQLDVRLMDDKNASLYGFLSHNFERETYSTIGLKLVVKLGKSYEEQQIEDLMKMVQELRSVAHRPGVHQEHYYKEFQDYIYK